MELTRILEAGNQYELCLEFQFVPSGKYILHYKYYSSFIVVKDFRNKNCIHKWPTHSISSIFFYNHFEIIKQNSLCFVISSV
jgi:hypothetical protein